MMDRTHDGKPFRMLCVIDEFTRECLAIRVERKLNARIVLETLADLFLLHGPPEHIRSDNGPEFVEKALRGLLERLSACTRLHRTWQPMGKRLLRELQLETSR